jgi:hypothetical protein
MTPEVQRIVQCYGIQEKGIRQVWIDAAAWGQAAFQGWRDVRNPSYTSSWAGTWAVPMGSTAHPQPVLPKPDYKIGDTTVETVSSWITAKRRLSLPPLALLLESPFLLFSF